MAMVALISPTDHKLSAVDGLSLSLPPSRVLLVDSLFGTGPLIALALPFLWRANPLLSSNLGSSPRVDLFIFDLAGLKMRYQRRQRTSFNKYQLDALHAAFKQNHYPEAPLRDHLAKATNLDPSRIQVWFQNQRAKTRKQSGILSNMSSPTDTSVGGHETSPSLLEQQLRGFAHHQQNQQQEHDQHHQRFLDKSSKQAQSCRGRLIDESVAGQLDSNYDDNVADNGYICQSKTKNSRNTIYVFNSVTANEAAIALSEGKFDSIVQYHRSKYGNVESDSLWPSSMF